MCDQIAVTASYWLRMPDMLNSGASVVSMQYCNGLQYTINKCLPTVQMYNVNYNIQKECSPAIRKS